MQDFKEVSGCRFQNCLVFFSSIDSFWLLLFWKFEKNKKKKIPNFLENHTEILKKFKKKIELEFKFTYAVQISSRSVNK